MADDKDVTGEGGFEHDGHVGRVEEFDGVSSSLSSVSVALDRNFDSESLEIDDEGEDGDGRDEIHDVGESFPVECLLQRSSLVVPSEEEMEEGDDGSFEFGSSTGVDGRRRESLPDDRLADVGRDEEIDS